MIIIIIDIIGSGAREADTICYYMHTVYLLLAHYNDHC